MSLYIELINLLTTDSLYKGILLLCTPLILLVPFGILVSIYCKDKLLRLLLAFFAIGTYFYCVVNSFSAMYLKI